MPLTEKLIFEVLMAPHFQLFISAEELFFKEKLSVLTSDKLTRRHRYPSERPPPRSSFGTENFSEDKKKKKKPLLLRISCLKVQTHKQPKNCLISIYNIFFPKEIFRRERAGTRKNVEGWHRSRHSVHADGCQQSPSLHRQRYLTLQHREERLAAASSSLPKDFENILLFLINICLWDPL